MPTISRIDKSFQGDPYGYLTESEEQSEADPNSLVLAPNCIRSDGKNNCRDVQTASDLNSMARSTVSLVAHTFRKVQPYDREPWKVHKVKAGRSAKGRKQRSSCDEVGQKTPTTDGLEGPLTRLRGWTWGKLVYRTGELVKVDSAGCDRMGADINSEQDTPTGARVTHFGFLRQ